MNTRKKASLSCEQMEKVLSNRGITPLLRQTIHLLEKGDLGKSSEFQKPHICLPPIA